MEVKTGGTAVGIAYWFTLHMYGDISISTYQPGLVSQIQFKKNVLTSSHSMNRVRATGIRVYFCSLKM